MYPFCFYFDVPATAYVTLIVVNLFIGLTATLATYILELFPSDSELNSIGSTLKIVFLVFPNYCFGRGLMDIAKNYYLNVYNNLAAQFGESAYQPFVDPLGWDIVGKNVFAMLIQGFFFFGVTLFIEFYYIRNMSSKPSYMSRLKSLLRIKGKNYNSLTAWLRTDMELQREDRDVSTERARANDPSQVEEAAVVVKDLAKVYGSSERSRKVAVNRLSFTVRKGECFGLLGVNGAVCGID